jgi:thiamine monophosphate kinase
LGGDTVSTKGPLFVSITAIGTLPRGTMVKRGGAKAGDVVMVTGTLGDAALELLRRKTSPKWKLSRAAAKHLAKRYLYPEPRCSLAAAVQRCANAAMDISDGLVGDLAKLCKVSGVSAEIEMVNVPLSSGGRRLRNPLHYSCPAPRSVPRAGKRCQGLGDGDRPHRLGKGTAAFPRSQECSPKLHAPFIQPFLSGHFAL